jgi:flagellar motor switch protein FliN/FliY
MTTLPLTSPSADLARAVEAASAVAAVLPSVEPLSAGAAQQGTEHVAASFAAAALTRLSGATSGALAVLVGSELVEALKASPMQGLDVAAAAQPALDAAAQVLGGAAAAAAEVALELVVNDLGGPFTVVPLMTSSGVGAAVLIADTLLGDVAPAPLPSIPDTASTQMADVTPLPRRGIEMLHGVDMELTVELGRTRMAVRDLLALAPGDVLELDRAAGSPADLLVNGRLIARGEVVVVDEDFGLRLTEIVDAAAG